MLRTLVVLVLVIGFGAGFVPLGAQTLYGVDGASGSLWEFALAPGAPCAQPNAMRFACPYSVVGCPGLAPPGLFLPPPAGRIGDVAVDSVLDNVWLTDGVVIEQYVGDRPCGIPAPCTPVSAFAPPPMPAGPITGMGMDEIGGVVTPPGPVLWLTDGATIAAVVPPPPGTCFATTFAFGPCAPSFTPVGAFTDITWDPVTSSLWLCDSAGFVYNAVPVPGSCIPGAPTFSVTGTCGLAPPLTGIAYDTSTPDVTTSGPASLFVTDGFTIANVTTTGAPAPPEFYAPTTCTPTNAPLSGLAFASPGVNYGTPRVTSTISSFGQSTTPSTTFGFEVTSVPAGSLVWVLYNFSVPGPGFFCPPLTGAGTTIWVDPTPPGGFFSFASPGVPCLPIAAPLPAGLPPGLQFFLQVLITPLSGPRATDATDGLSVTVSLP